VNHHDVAALAVDFDEPGTAKSAHQARTTDLG